MSNATELLAIKTYIIDALDPQDVATIAMHAVGKAATPALARGWTGREIAGHSIAGIYDGTVENFTGYIIAGINELSTVNPPRETTPTPPPFTDVHATINKGHTPAANPTQWADRIRAQAH